MFFYGYMFRMTGFHAAMIAFAAIQVHETRSALVVAGSTEYVVSKKSDLTHTSTVYLCSYVGWQRPRISLAQSLTILDCCTDNHRSIVDNLDVLGQRAVL